MSNVSLKNLPNNIVDLIKYVGQHADHENASAYLVGGVVRDLLLKKENFDLDIVIEINAIDFAETFSKVNGFLFVKHPKFMTATVNIDKNIHIDFVTARKESYTKPGALPDVVPSTIEDDLFRRDFTINAMALVINDSNFGKIVDFYQGQKDLEDKIIRVFHEQSFVDDPTRILRAIRFEQRFDFKMDDNTEKAMEIALSEPVIMSVTPIRYFEEFKKICVEPRAASCFRRLADIGMLKNIFDNFAFDDKCFELFDSIESFLVGSNFKNFSFKSWIIYMMAILDCFSLEEAKKMLVRFSIEKKDQQKIIFLKKNSNLSKQLLIEQINLDEVFDGFKTLSVEEMIFFYCKNKKILVQQCIDEDLKEIISKGVFNGANGSS